MGKKKMGWVVGEDTHRENGLCADCFYCGKVYKDEETDWYCSMHKEKILEGVQMNGCSYYMQVEYKVPNELNKKILLGKLNNALFVNAWEMPEDEECNSGDYAIVENINDYDLVKVIGTTWVNKKYVSFLTDRRKLKKVIQVIPREDVRED